MLFSSYEGVAAIAEYQRAGVNLSNQSGYRCSYHTSAAAAQLTRFQGIVGASSQTSASPKASAPAMTEDGFVPTMHFAQEQTSNPAGVYKRLFFPAAPASGEAAGETAAEVAEDGKCETCENRKYQDGSDDPGVSFKTAGKIDKSVAASTIRAHEHEHVKRNAAEAQREGREVVMSRVVLHTGVCPECGDTYYSGGTTTTVTRNAPEQSSPFDPESGANLAKTTVDADI